jgi:23S rRNA (uracil1939-C5)-methyltransferase
VQVNACPVATEGINVAIADHSSPLYTHTGDSPRETTVFDAGSAVYYSDRDANASVEVLGYRFGFDPRGFSQSNVALLPALGRSLAEAVTATAIVDLYAGAGLLPFLALAAAPEKTTVSRVFAVEPDLRNLRFLRGNITSVDSSVRVATRRATAEKALPSVKWRSKATVLLDPPRGGVSATVRRWIVQMSERISEVIYLSCDSAALARDLGVFTDRYEITDTVLFDFYPQTAHIETLVVLRPRRSAAE